MSHVSPPPLTGTRVLELAGLAPGPYAGLTLADYGASVLRLDRPHPAAHSSEPAPPTPDLLTRRKTSIALSLKSPGGRGLFLELLPHVDILIDPYRPGVLENLGLDPGELCTRFPRLIVARLTGFRRTGKYGQMAGHDLNYLAVSGVLSLLGRRGDIPAPPANLLADFAGGGQVLVTGILMALLQRARTGRGQIVDASMVDGAAHVATFPRLMLKTPMWNRPRGENVLDGGCPWYDVYETKDQQYMAVAALEPQFFAELVRGLRLDVKHQLQVRDDRKGWDRMRSTFASEFRKKTRADWEQVFDGTDACVTPVLNMHELEQAGYEQRPLVSLSSSPGAAIHSHAVAGRGWHGFPLYPGQGGEDTLRQWTGWARGEQYHVEDGGLVRRPRPGSRL